MNRLLSKDNIYRFIALQIILAVNIIGWQASAAGNGDRDKTEVSKGTKKTGFYGLSKIKVNGGTNGDFAKGDSIFNACLLLPLTQKYDQERVFRMMGEIDRTPDSWKTDDFRTSYQVYMPLLMKYSKYNRQLVANIDRLIELVGGAGDNIATAAIQTWLNQFMSGELPAKEEGKTLGFEYLTVYKEREANASIEYLDLRIDEVKSLFSRFSHSTNISAAGELTGGLLEIRRMLLPETDILTQDRANGAKQKEAKKKDKNPRKKQEQKQTENIENQLTPAEILDAIDRHNQDISRLKADRAELQKELDEYDKHKDLYKEDITDLKKRIRALTIEIDSHRKAISKLESEKK